MGPDGRIRAWARRRREPPVAWTPEHEIAIALTQQLTEPEEERHGKKRPNNG
jgi:hypothetical protein